MVVDNICASFKVSKQEAINILKELKEEGLIVEDENKKIATAKKMGLVKGTVSGHSRGFAFVVPTDSAKPHLFIAPKNLNTAMHNDTVLVKVLQGRRGDSTEAEIMHIVKRGTVNIVGKIEVLKGYGFLIPDNNKFSTDIFIPKKRMLNAKNGEKVVVKITNFDARRPEGEVIEVLGDGNSPEIELLSIIRSYDLIEEFSPELLNSMKKIAS